MHKRTLFTLCASIALTLATADLSRAGLIGNDLSGVLYDVSTTTGATTNPRSTGISSLAGVAFSGSTLYGLSTFGGSTPNSLFSINPVTGTASLVGATGLSNIFEGDVATDPTTGALYGVQNVPSTGVRQLFTLNTATGAATVIGSIPATTSDLSAMAFNAAGDLFVVDTAASALLKVNKANAAIISTVPLSATPAGNVGGLAFDPSTGTAYFAIGSGANSLYRLDTSTGNLTLVGTNIGLAGLAFTPAATVPEPGTAALLLSAFAGLAAIRRRSRRT